MNISYCQKQYEQKRKASRNNNINKRSSIKLESPERWMINPPTSRTSAGTGLISYLKTSFFLNPSELAESASRPELKQTRNCKHGATLLR